MSAEELHTTATRIVAAKKLFNVRAGWTPSEDTLPPRLLEHALADDPAVFDDHAADAWIGCRRVEAAPGKFERLLHESMVGGREHYFSIRRARLVPGFFTSRIASRKSSTR